MLDPIQRPALSSVDTSRGCAGHCGRGRTLLVRTESAPQIHLSLILKVLSPPNFIDKFGTHSTFQLLHNLFFHSLFPFRSPATLSEDKMSPGHVILGPDVPPDTWS